jgi:hypothetical protein
MAEEDFILFILCVLERRKEHTGDVLIDKFLCLFSKYITMMQTL